jgi:hypothetical protein
MIDRQPHHRASHRSQGGGALMRLDATTAATVDLAQLVVALRRWYEATGDARPNRLLTDLAKIRARNNGTPNEQIERGLLLLTVQRGGPLDIPDPSGPPPEGLSATRTRAPYPRGRSGPRPSRQGGTR